MPNYMVLYCLDKQACGWSERVDLVSDSERVTSCPECQGLALIYEKEHTDYISDPTDHATDLLILNLALLGSLPPQEE